LLDLVPKPCAEDKSPVDSVAALQTFVARQAAFIAQTAMFGYLKQRMGTRYSEIFQSATFSAVIQKSSAHVFVSCAMDLTTFATAKLAAAEPALRPQADRLAAAVFDAALRQGLADLDVDIAIDDAVAAFAARRAETDWTAVLEGENAFSSSPADLVRHAPVIDDLKELDSEVVMNSMRFRWHEVRRRLRARLDPAAVAADWVGR